MEYIILYVPSIAVAGLTITSIVLYLRLLIYKKLCVKLTETIKLMYCEVKGCKHYRYNTQPIDGGNGYMDKMCALHMSERIEREGKEKITSD